MAMMAAVENLTRLGISLPQVSAPLAAYLPFVRSGNQVFISGQLPKNAEGKLHAIGKLYGPGATENNSNAVDLETAQKAAYHCGINLIAVMKSACGDDLSRIKRIVKVEGFVASHESFHEHHLVINGCSELLRDVFGQEIGAHSRFAIGCSSLPLDACVEIGAVVELRD